MKILKGISRLLVALGSLLATCSSMAATLSLHPATQTVAPNTNIVLTLDIQGVTDLYAVQFGVSFPEDGLAAQGVSEGPFLSSGGTTFFSDGAIDNATGTIALSMGGLLGAVSGVSGSGTLASITFQTLPALASHNTIALNSVVLLDSSGAPISVDIQTADIISSVAPPPSQPSAIPTTGGGAMTLLVLLIAALSLRRLTSGKSSLRVPTPTRSV
jgi:hypothetical protein